MPNSTQTLGLTKPLKSERYNVDVFNENADKIDRLYANTIEDLKAKTGCVIGDIVEVLGYYTKGDGGGHPRQKKPAGYNGADAVIGVDGSIWGIVHNGEINASWFGLEDERTYSEIELMKIFEFCKGLKINFTRSTFNINPNLLKDLNTNHANFEAELTYGKINIFSNCEIDFNFSSVNVIPNDNRCYIALNVCEKENVKIKNLIIKGDKYTHSYTVHSEWGYLINFAGSKNVELENCFISESMGDGIMFNIFPFNDRLNQSLIKQNENITIKNCIITDNRRQGVSVMSALNSRINSCKITDTSGTSPATGIDFEPVENCIIEDFFVSENVILGNDPNNVGGRSDILAIIDQNVKDLIKVKNVFITNNHMNRIQLSYVTDIDVKENKLNQVVLNYTNGTIIKDNKFENSKIDEQIIINGCSNTSIIDNESDCLKAAFITFKENYKNYNTKIISNTVSDPLFFCRYNFPETVDGVLVKGNTIIGQEHPASFSCVNGVIISNTSIKAKGAWLSVSDNSKPTSNYVIRNVHDTDFGNIFSGTVMHENYKLGSINLSALDTPYHATNMKKLGILDSYHQYLTELHEYEKQQNIQSDTGVMNLNVIQPPVIPTKVEAYAKEYNLI